MCKYNPIIKKMYNFDNISDGIIASLIGTLIISTALFLFQEKVRIIVNKFFIWLRNRQFRIKLLMKYRINKKPKDFTNEIFKKIKEQNNKFHFEKLSLRENLLQIKPVELGTRIIVQISSVYEELCEDESDLEQIDHDEINEYDLEIYLGDEIRLGINDLETLNQYLIIINSIKDIVIQLAFENNRETKKFIICDLIRNTKPITKEREIIINEKDCKVSFINKDIKFVLKNHEFLENLIKQYIAY